MLVRRMNGFNPVVQLRNEMNRLATQFGAFPESFTTAGGFPPLNVWESGDEVYVEAELPGVKDEDIDISVMGTDLTIRGRRGPDQPDGVTYHRQERGFGQFNRVLRLPIEVDANRVEATLRDGVLTIHLPKAESAKPRKIQVKPGT